jgi:hypothetical protein
MKRYSSREAVLAGNAEHGASADATGFAAGAAEL